MIYLQNLSGTDFRHLLNRNNKAIVIILFTNSDVLLEALFWRQIEYKFGMRGFCWVIESQVEKDKEWTLCRWKLFENSCVVFTVVRDNLNNAIQKNFLFREVCIPNKSIIFCTRVKYLEVLWRIGRNLIDSQTNFYQTEVPIFFYQLKKINTWTLTLFVHFSPPRIPGLTH